MAFSIKELAISLESAGEHDQGWVVLIGCGHQSAMPVGAACRSGTDMRYYPIDFQHGIKTDADIKALRACLQKMLAGLSPGPISQE